MVGILIIGWIIGVVGCIIGLIGFTFFVKGVSILKKDYYTKRALNYLLITCIIVELYHIIIVIFGFVKPDITNKWLIVLPLMYIFIGIFWYFGTYNLMQLVKEAKEENE